MYTKEEILKEVKRTTRENGGKPLGAARFRSATGIGRYDWNRYWALFTELQQEAVSKHNEPWRRVSDKILIKKMISKIRKYGNYPSLSRLHIDGVKDKNFPFTIIKKRGQKYIVKKIVEYCKNKKGYKDILKACQPIIEKFDKKEKIDDSVTISELEEVYLLKSGLDYKIGHADDPIRRASEIGTLLAERPELIHSFKTDDPAGVESYWHKRFQEKRKRGEWFKLNSQDVKAFKRWKKIY